MRGQLRVVGIGHEGCASLTSRAINAVAEAEIVAGSERQLSFVPQFTGQRMPMTSPYSAFINQVVEAAKEQDVCLLASGDPLFFGIGNRILALAETHDVEVEVIPSLSSVQLACARVGWSSHDMTMLSVHGRSISGLVAKLQQSDKFALLTDKLNTPQAIGQYLQQFDETGWQLQLCEALGGNEERTRAFSVAQLAEGAAGEVDPLNVLLLKRDQQPIWGGYPLHSPDTSYDKRVPSKGLITKAPVRAVAVANMQLRPDSTVWDIGAGSGSVSVEAAKLSWHGQCFAVECNPDCYPGLEGNRLQHKVDNLQIIKQKAPLGLDALPDPDAVFCGGSRGEMPTLFAQVMQRLRVGGRFIVSAVTLDSVTEIFSLCKQHQIEPQVMLLQISQSKPLAQYTLYQGENPIHLFIIEKKAEGQ